MTAHGDGISAQPDEREKFEAWARGHFLRLIVDDVCERGADRYRHHNVQLAWLGWQAATKETALPSLPAQPVEKCPTCGSPHAQILGQPLAPPETACPKCGKPMYFHVDTYYHVHAADVMTCQAPPEPMGAEALRGLTVRQRRIVLGHIEALSARIGHKEEMLGAAILVIAELQREEHDLAWWKENALAVTTLLRAKCSDDEWAKLNALGRFSSRLQFLSTAAKGEHD